VLGTAPVEEDGSVHFKMPTGTPIYFQLLDENGLAVQTMRSDTYLHPGETLNCLGCHEAKGRAPKVQRQGVPLALRRAPSALAPEAEGSYPLTFPRLVQPVLNARCVGCHDRNKKAPSLHGDRFSKNGWSEAFYTLHKLSWGMSGGNGTAQKERQYSMPGQDGARVSKLYQMLAKGHHDVKPSREEMRRITLWLDCNSNFYGAYTEPDKQARGEVVRPKWGVPGWREFAALVR
jgi:cytochrome c553